LRDEITQYSENIDEINRYIYKLEEETKDEIINEIESKKAIKEGNLKDKEDEINKLTECIDEGIKVKINELKQEETRLRLKHSQLEVVKDKLEELKNVLENYAAIFNKNIDDLNHDLSKLFDNLTIPQLDFGPQQKSINRALNLIPREINNVKKNIGEKKSQLNRLSGIEKKHADLLKEIEKSPSQNS